MKTSLIMIVGALMLLSCHKKETNKGGEAAQQRLRIDSINASRKKHNDSILAQRNKSKFQDLSGSHTFTMASEGISTLKGSVLFTKTGGDEYKITGEAQSGNNKIAIKGTAELVRANFLHFEGEISQSIPANGKPYTRKGSKTFMAKEKDQFWRLQDMINGDGFVDYIDIHFK